MIGEKGFAERLRQIGDDRRTRCAMIENQLVEKAQVGEVEVIDLTGPFGRRRSVERSRKAQVFALGDRRGSSPRPRLGKKLLPGGEEQVMELVRANEVPH